MIGSLGTGIVIISIGFSALAAAAVALRFYCRSIKKTAYGIDDWLIIPALLATIGSGIAVTVDVFAGRLGQYPVLSPDGNPISDGSTEVFNRVAFVGQILTTVCFTFAKLSILFFYRRIFIGAIFNAFSWTLIILSAVWGIVFLIAAFTEIVPIQHSWINTVVDNSENDDYTQYWIIFASVVSSVIIDIAILCIPWPNIWQLQLPAKQKFAVVGIFMLGGFICGIGIARIAFFVQSIQASNTDPTNLRWYLALPMYWTQLEAAFAVICACLPMLRPALGIFSLRCILGTRDKRASHLPTRKNPSSGRRSSSFYLHSLSSQPPSTGTITDAVPERSVAVRHDDLVYPSSLSVDNSGLAKNDR